MFLGSSFAAEATEHPRLRKVSGKKMLSDSLLTVNMRYGTFSFFAHDIGAVSQSLRAYGEWAENELGFLKKFLATGATVIDVGAYVGTHTLAFSQIVGPTGSVVSIEAQQAAFDLLKKNVKINQVRNVRLECAVASNANGKLTIPSIDPLHDSSFGSASLQAVFNDAKSIGDVKSEVVKSLTIDSLDLAQCALIKMDAEGMESIIIEGASNTIQRTRPVIYAESNSVADGLRVFDALKKQGYLVRMHVVDAFNPDNFFGDKTNLFGAAREVALVGVSPDRIGHLDSIKPRSCELILDIETADDLVLGLLNKPQYPGEILRNSAAGQSGGEAWLNRAHLGSQIDPLQAEALPKQIAALQTSLARAEADRDVACTELAVTKTELAISRESIEAERTERERLRAERASVSEVVDATEAKLRSAIAQRDDVLARIEAQRTELERLRAELAGAFAMVEAARTRLGAATTQRDAALLRFEAELREEKSARIRDIEDGKAMTDNALRQAHFARADADRFCVEVKTLSRRLAEADRFRVDSDRLSHRLAEAAARSVELERQVADSDKMLKAILGSSSWRLSAPLRTVAGWLRRSRS